MVLLLGISTYHKSSGFCLRLFFLHILPIPSNTITVHKLPILNSTSPVQIPCLFSTLAYAFSYLTFPPWCLTAIKTTELNMVPLSDLPNLLFLFLCILFSCLCFIIMTFISHYFRSFLFYYILHHFAINEPISHQSFLLPLVLLDSIFFSLILPPFVYLRSLAFLASNMVTRLLAGTLPCHYSPAKQIQYVICKAT